MKKKRAQPVIFLLLLAPMLGELLSGSQPPVDYFQIIPFLLLTMLYGVGAVLIRETVRRWDKGWVSIILLGMAYGIFEEGAMVRSFFDPSWPDLQLLASYGRWIGINWIWAIALTLFHSIVSITVPIMITELVFHRQKQDLWLSKKAFITFWAIFSINLFLGPLFGMKITVLGMVASFISITGLALLANTWTEEPESDQRAVAREWKIVLAGFILMALFIAGMWIFPALNIPWVLDFFYLSFLPWVGMAWMNRLGRKGWAERHEWAAATGLLIPWLLLAIISELDNASRVDDTSGMSLVAAGFAVFLIVLRVMIARRETENSLTEQGIERR